ncbi:uncharacterized protein LAESUDRAFT_762872 [Laetiporus sulphureus 93-53]|uniref:Uncharacterized protein n=1 Tax=Laetiporus sulphureus 93-53 TaxID=1314785 RepID=A0A165C6T5_9APHY|nr:uncharacterized protein LAESUDRAFT_762872 [Laetiporus sulphureus 93-53]KZT02300.1 hypothetical protein LAESUDRAFT_762872 [Laetiporus sulphureus 93-53]
MVSAVLTLLRVYAVTGRDWRPTIIFALLACANLGLDIVLDLVNKSTGVIVLESTAICYSFPQNSFASTYTKLNTILVSRILLNIQETARAAQREQSDTPSFVRSGHGVQTEAYIDIPSLVILSDASNSVPAIGSETEPSVATANRINAVVNETMIAGPSNQHRHHEAQQVEMSMEAGPSGQGREYDVEQGQAEGEAAEDWEEEDDWEDDY